MWQSLQEYAEVLNLAQKYLSMASLVLPFLLNRLSYLTPGIEIDTLVKL